MPKRGKKYQEVVKLVDPDQNYTPAEAVDLVKKTSYTKFNATVEAHLRMGLDPRKADQLIRSTVQLPHGTGREVRVLVFAEGDGQNPQQVDDGAGAGLHQDERLRAKIHFRIGLDLQPGSGCLRRAVGDSVNRGAAG